MFVSPWVGTFVPTHGAISPCGRSLAPVDDTDVREFEKEPVGINTARALLRINASTGTVLDTLVRELDVSRTEADAALHAARQQPSRARSAGGDALRVHDRRVTIAGRHHRPH